MIRPWILALLRASVAMAVTSCGSKTSVPVEPQASAAAVPPAPPPSSAPSAAAAPQGPFADWLRAHVPPSGKVVTRSAGALAIEHTVTAADTPLSIAQAYLDLTGVYRAEDLAKEIERLYPTLAVGTTIEVPHLVTEPTRSPDDDRLRWPPERALKGVYISGMFGGLFWPETIEKLAARKLNAVVLDAKSYDGPITYPTAVKLAIDTGAADKPPIRDFSRAIRFAHARGVHVIARISCFHDPWTAKKAPRLSLMSKSGHPFEMGWIDPSNPEAQEYILALVKEAVDLGADEVQLDYIRFPVQSRGIANAALPPPDGHRTQAIKAFVQRVHEVTAAKQVPLSLDVFGVAATGDSSDIEALGQNLGIVGPEAEAVSPMVYPSHYAKGFNGYDEPGNHPEIVGMGTRSAALRLKAQKKETTTVVRPWLQAMPYKVSTFGPRYIAAEIRSAESSGGVGWLMWDPTNSYWAVWQAVPVAP